MTLLPIPVGLPPALLPQHAIMMEGVIDCPLVFRDGPVSTVPGTEAAR